MRAGVEYLCWTCVNFIAPSFVPRLEVAKVTRKALLQKLVLTDMSHLRTVTGIDKGCETKAENPLLTVDGKGIYIDLKLIATH